MCFSQCMAVFAKPAPVRSIVRHDAGNLVPEGVGMIHIGQMAELVDNDVVGDLGRRHHKPVIKRQSTRLGAASPTGFLISDGNSFVGAACLLLQLGTALGKI